MTQKEKFTCPECGSRSMIKLEKKTSKTYIFKCASCKATSQPLPLKNANVYI